MNEKLATALAELAAQLGTTVPYLWSTLVDGVAYRAIADVIGWLMFAAVCAFPLWRWRKHFTNEAAMMLPMLGLVIGIVFFCSAFGAVSSMTDAIVALVSPEYAALEKIVKVLR